MKKLKRFIVPSMILLLAGVVWFPAIKAAAVQVSNIIENPGFRGRVYFYPGTSITSDMDVSGGDIVLENDEEIINATDGDIALTFNDDATTLGQVYIVSSIDSPLVADNDIFEIIFQANDDSSNYVDWGTIQAKILDASDDSEDSQIAFQTWAGGSEVTVLTILQNTLTTGIAGTGYDVQFFSSTSGDHFLWDASEEALTIIGTNAQDALNVDDGNVDIADDIDVDGTSNLDIVDIDGAVDMATTLAVTGVTTLTGGVSYATNSPFHWSQGGSTVLATSGTDQAPTDGPRQWVAIQIPYNCTLTGIGYLVGSVGGTDSVVVELFNSAGTAVARSIAADTSPAALVGTAANFQNVDFSSTYAAVAGTYYISVQMNGTTARLRTYPIPGSKFVAATAAGTFKTGASITPGTTFTADEGPISYVY